MDRAAPPGLGDLLPTSLHVRAVRFQARAWRFVFLSPSRPALAPCFPPSSFSLSLSSIIYQLPIICQTIIYLLIIYQSTDYHLSSLFCQPSITSQSIICHLLSMYLSFIIYQSSIIYSYNLSIYVSSICLSVCLSLLPPSLPSRQHSAVGSVCRSLGGGHQVTECTWSPRLNPVVGSGCQGKHWRVLCGPQGGGAVCHLTGAP